MPDCRSCRNDLNYIWALAPFGALLASIPGRSGQRRMQMPQSQLPKTSLSLLLPSTGGSRRPSADTGQGLGTMALVLFALGMIASLWLG